MKKNTREEPSPQTAGNHAPEKSGVWYRTSYAYRRSDRTCWLVAFAWASMAVPACARIWSLV